MNISDHSLPWLEFDDTDIQTIAGQIRAYTRRAEADEISESERVRRETEDALRDGLA